VVFGWLVVFDSFCGFFLYLGIPDVSGVFLYLGLLCLGVFLVFGCGKFWVAEFSGFGVLVLVCFAGFVGICRFSAFCCVWSGIMCFW